MKRMNYEVKCLLCGTEAGQVLHGKLVPHGTPGPRLLHGEGVLRCGRCGGGLYLERTETYASVISQARRSKQFAEESARAAPA